MSRRRQESEPGLYGGRKFRKGIRRNVVDGIKREGYEEDYPELEEELLQPDALVTKIRDWSQSYISAPRNKR